MQICFTSDLHGITTLYDQLSDLIHSDPPDLLILGGDLLPDGDRHDPMSTQVASVEQMFLPRIAAWRADVPDMMVACLCGNHEWQCTRDALSAAAEAGLLVLLDPTRTWTHEGVSFVGYGCTPATPHWLKDYERLDFAGDPIPEFGGVCWDAAHRGVREVDTRAHFAGRKSIADDMASIPYPPSPWVLVAHAPPYQSKLDRLPHVSFPVGSRAVRQFIEQRKPDIALHGHVHESPKTTGSFHDVIGSTLSINPGQDRQRLHAVQFDHENPLETLRHTVMS